MNANFTTIQDVLIIEPKTVGDHRYDQSHLPAPAVIVLNSFIR